MLDQTCYYRFTFEKRGFKFAYVSQCLLHETGALCKTPGNILPCATASVCEQKLMGPILCVTGHY